MAKRSSGTSTNRKRSVKAGAAPAKRTRRATKGVKKTAKRTARGAAVAKPTGGKSARRRGDRVRAAAGTPEAKARRRADSARRAAKTPRGKRSRGTASGVTSAATAVRGMVAGAIAAISQRMPWGPDTPDAITLLETDHRRLEDLLARGEATGDGAAAERRTILDTITSELNLHELIEEKVFYPALQSHPEATDKVLEGYQEHHVADAMLTELHQLAVSDEQWRPKFKVLQESIQHHIDEEEGAMFRTARAVFSSDELKDLGRRMAAMKAEAQGAGRPAKRARAKADARGSRAR